MTFREKHLWISVLATVVVWSVYFRDLIARVLAGEATGPDFAMTTGIGFAGAIFVVAVVEVSLTVIATMTTPKAERDIRDEREMLAAYKASHVSMSLLVVLVISLAAATWISGLTRDALFTGPGAMVVLANLLVACVVLSELTRFGFTLYLLRRGR